MIGFFVFATFPKTIQKSIYQLVKLKYRRMELVLALPFKIKYLEMTISRKTFKKPEYPKLSLLMVSYAVFTLLTLIVAI